MTVTVIAVNEVSTGELVLTILFWIQLKTSVTLEHEFVDPIDINARAEDGVISIPNDAAIKENIFLSMLRSRKIFS